MNSPQEELEAVALTAVPPCSTLTLDAQSRGIAGVEMTPLLSGEFALLEFLGTRPFTWHSSRGLCIQVYRRSDEAARQLVWKYISTLRKKLASVTPAVIGVCRRRGYSCRAQVVVVGSDARLTKYSPSPTP
jgi:DNA-binding response OmpR family regulator